MKNIGKDAGSAIKGKVKVPWTEKGERAPPGGFSNNQKQLLTYETDLTNFGDILESILSQLVKIREELETNLNEINYNYIIENVDNFAFKEELLTYKKISTELKEKEVEFSKNLAKNIILKVKDMKDDNAEAINQIQARLASRKTLENEILSAKGPVEDYKGKRLEQEEEIFLKEIKMFCNEFDVNLKEIVNEFLSESKSLDRIEVDMSTPLV